jgi:very-short-patch-repair endonuclease
MPAKLERPRVPALPLRRRAFEREGRELRPLAGPEIPIPEPQDEQLQAAYEQWRAVYNGSLPEYIVFKWLVEQKDQVLYVDFIFQHPMFGGRTIFGGFILDFYFPLRLEAWRVNGLRWHLERAENRAKDSLAKVIVTQRGITVIDLWEDDILQRPDFVLNLAWERSQSASGRRGFTL